MTNGDTSRIHRYLDEMFETVQMTPELHDLKEELKAGLGARVDELMTAVTSAQEAAVHAIIEFGDLDGLIAEVSGRSDHQVLITAAFRVNRVRPLPAFVVRTVILAIILSPAVIPVAVNAFGLFAWPAAALLV